MEYRDLLALSNDLVQCESYVQWDQYQVITGLERISLDQRHSLLNRYQMILDGNQVTLDAEHLILDGYQVALDTEHWYWTHIKCYWT
jgi:hypothetical protein